MKKTIAILLTALLLLTVFVSCEGDVEDLFGDNITITFNGNGSTSGQMAPLKVAKGKEVRLTANAYEKTDSEFTGWNTKADGSGVNYDDEEFVYFEEDTTLYAQWGDVGVTITFDANDGSGTMDPVKVSADVYELPENGFTAPEGYAFVRWSETADGEVEYEVGDELEVTDDVTLYAIWAQVLSETPDLLLSGRYTITENTPIDNRFGASGTLKLYLPDGLTLNAKKGIQVTEEYTLIINKLGTEGTGTLLIDTVEDYAAGIGGGLDGNGGTIVINGGTVTATGGENAAGIGGGGGGAGGIITINGGKVTATSCGYGAGIGGGSGKDGGKITIYGGTVTATGGMYAAGIGGGYNGAGGTISISGGTVTAIGGNSGVAGIGGGNGSSDHGALTIGTGYVLTGGSASADTLLLGPVDSETTYTGASHPRYMNVSTVSEIKDSTSAITLKSGVYTTDKTDTEVTVSERITVEGNVFLLLPDGKTLTASKGITVSTDNSLTIFGSGTLVANSQGINYYAGIGGDSSNEDCGVVTINGGTVNATGGEDATGIGGGVNGNGGTVTINGGIVTANGGENAAGIGGGVNGNGGTVTINGGIVTANGGEYAAGIGGGVEGDGGTVTINGGTVTATGGEHTEAGIGAGTNGSSQGDLTIGASVSVWVKDSEGASWGPYVLDVRHRYMKADEVN